MWFVSMALTRFDGIMDPRLITILGNTAKESPLAPHNQVASCARFATFAMVARLQPLAPVWGTPRRVGRQHDAKAGIALGVLWTALVMALCLSFWLTLRFPAVSAANMFGNMALMASNVRPVNSSTALGIILLGRQIRRRDADAPHGEFGFKLCQSAAVSRDSPVRLADPVYAAVGGDADQIGPETDRPPRRAPSGRSRQGCAILRRLAWRGGAVFGSKN
jgi:hypothetical protein